ncbi:MAG: peptidylprolyl isomerase [Nannocystaceae bacterium]|nr:peptidylprolyl isomerase [Nannocystaceae bacterium]
MRLKTDTAVEARVEAIAALGSLGRSAKPDKGDDKGDTDAPQVVPWLDDFIALGKDDNQAIRDAARLALSSWPEQVAAFDAAVPKSFPQGFSPAVHAALDGAAGVTGLRMHTAAGEITIDFAGAPAPIAQANLAALAETGYFDGLTFHRVVPAFVVQGGDPRGDGYGGPGHVLPCEWSNLRYERGTVGIALAGKDTGGSQIFISHGAPHHLDARYPIIGRVVEGLDVVDRLLPFDAIDSVDVLTR